MKITTLNPQKMLREILPRDPKQLAKDIAEMGILIGGEVLHSLKEATKTAALNAASTAIHPLRVANRELDFALGLDKGAEMLQEDIFAWLADTKQDHTLTARERLLMEELTYAKGQGFTVKDLARFLETSEEDIETTLQALREKAYFFAGEDSKKYFAIEIENRRGEKVFRMSFNPSLTYHYD
jgi:hypothetical protein